MDKKPVVPTYIDTWIQGCKYNGFDLLEAMTLIDGPEETGRWISDNPETFAKAWLYDYDVEKEKLYTVELPNPNSFGFGSIILRRNNEGKIYISFSVFNRKTWRCDENAQLTEAEIKQDFEWAWQFAKELEE